MNEICVCVCKNEIEEKRRKVFLKGSMCCVSDTSVSVFFFSFLFEHEHVVLLLMFRYHWWFQLLIVYCVGTFAYCDLMKKLKRKQKKKSFLTNPHSKSQRLTPKRESHSFIVINSKPIFIDKGAIKDENRKILTENSQIGRTWIFWCALNAHHTHKCFFFMCVCVFI